MVGKTIKKIIKTIDSVPAMGSHQHREGLTAIKGQISELYQQLQI